MIDFKKHGDLIDVVCKKYGINTPLRKAHFLAQVDHETNSLKKLVENLNYSVQGLISTFGRHRISLDQCRLFGRTNKQKANQRQIANTLYGGTWGQTNLGNILPGDGWTYRGRAAFMCTGRNMYKLYSDYTGVDFVSNPDKILEAPYYLDFAGWYWNHKKLSVFADNDDIKGITKKINGGLIGIDKRTLLLDTYKTIK